MNSLTKNFGFVYSDTIGSMIPRGFVRKYSIGDEVIIGDEHFTWCENDCMYWSDDIDGKGFEYDDILTPFISRISGRRVDFLFDRGVTI